MTSQYKKTSPSRKGLNPSSFSKFNIKQLIVYVYGTDKNWKLHDEGATSHFGIEVSRERLINMAITKLENPYAED